MRRGLLPIALASVTVYLTPLWGGCGLSTVARADDPTASGLVPQKIGEHYPESKAYSAWRALSLDSCQKPEDVSDLAVGDLDGDALLEVVFSSFIIQKSKTVYVVKRNARDGKWGCPEALNVSQPVTRVAIVSLEPDQPPAIIAASSCDDRPCLLKLQAKPSSASTLLYKYDEAPKGSVATDFRVADLDEDGVLDIALSAADLKTPTKAIAPVILTGRLKDNTWGWTRSLLEKKISYGLAIEVGIFSAEGHPGLLFGGIWDGCKHDTRERQPVGVLALHAGSSWQTSELETKATGESDQPRWVVDLALGTRGTEVGLAAAQSHCPGSANQKQPYGCTADSRPELKAMSSSPTPSEPVTFAKQSGEWRALNYFAPKHWALGFVETEAYQSDGATLFRSMLGGVLLVEEGATTQTSRVPGAAIQTQDIVALSLRPHEELEQLRVTAKAGTLLTAYPLQFAPELLCNGKPTPVDGLTWVPESRLVGIAKLPSPCAKPELAYLADRRPALVALDRADEKVLISEPQ